MTRYVVESARPGDTHLVKDSWRRSLQDAPAYSSMPVRAYVAYANDVIAHFMDGEHGIPSRPCDRLIVARDRERPVYVYGWMLYRDMRPGLALVFLYTKSCHRRDGVASELLANALSATESGPYTYAFRTLADKWLQSYGFEYRPVGELERDDRRAS